MTGRLEGKVAFVTGAGRGQGQMHAVRFAEEGADVIAVDICGPVDSVQYRLASEADLAETVRLVEQAGGSIRASKADVRDLGALRTAVDDGVEHFGGLDIVSANAGIFSVGAAHELSEASWADMIDINLNGVWHTAKATVPHLLERGGGSIIITSSGNGRTPAPMYAHYCAAKAAALGLMKSLAMELGGRGIRVNAVLPAAVATDMIRNFRDMSTTSVRYVPSDDPNAPFQFPNLLKPVDISNLLVFLASDESRYVSGEGFLVSGLALVGAGGPGDDEILDGRVLLASSTSTT